MPPYGQKKKEGFSMTLQFPHKAQQEDRWLAPLLTSILAAVSLVVTVASVSLAVAAECQVIEEGGMIQEMPAWKGTTSNTLPLTITMARDIYGGLVPPPVLEVATYMKSSRIAWGNMENQEVAIIGSCLSQDIRKSALFNRAMITSIGKTQAKVPTKTMKVFALPYNGKRQIHAMRTTQPEIGIPSRHKASTIIGPVQEIQKSILSDESSVSQAVATLPATVESFSLLGGQPFVVVNPIQNALPLPDNESLRMNRTTTQALHEGNCASGCP
jgi:hypothetical protein